MYEFTDGMHGMKTMGDQEKATLHHLRMSNALRLAGWRVAHHDGMVLVLYDGKAWQVVGGDAVHPSMKMRPEVDPQAVAWSDADRTR